MDYIAVIDYQHLDNGLFLKMLARSLARHNRSRGLIIHGESEYTERLIQTGMIREDAVIRAVKELNHRLIALFADHGIPTIGINGYQRSMVTLGKASVEIDRNQFNRLPAEPHVLLSNLVEHHTRNKPVPLDLDKYAFALSNAFDIEDIILFCLDDSDDFLRKERLEKLSRKELNSSALKLQVPSSFRNCTFPVRLTSARAFGEYPVLKESILIV